MLKIGSFYVGVPALALLVALGCGESNNGSTGGDSGNAGGNAGSDALGGGAANGGATADGTSAGASDGASNGDAAGAGTGSTTGSVSDGSSTAADSGTEAETAAGNGSGTGGGSDAAAGAGGSSGTGGDGSSGTGGGGGNDTAGGGGTGGGAGACSGKPGAPGSSTRTLMNGSEMRSYVLHIPDSLDPNQAAPVVFVFHGFTMSGQIMHDLTDFPAVADREGFVVAFPDGGGVAPWNVGTGVCGAGAAVGAATDDFGFVEKMLDAIEADQCIDRDKVFVTGFSMGGYFSNHIGCQRGGMLRAVAPHSGGTYPGDCPGAPVPIMILHGTGDGLIAPDCGTGARDLWLSRNGCSSDFENRPVKGGHCEWYKDCDPRGQVVACLFDGMPHAWAGAPQGLYGAGPNYESATELIWDFFKQQL